jgi:hypothetical protein
MKKPDAYKSINKSECRVIKVKDEKISVFLSASGNNRKTVIAIFMDLLSNYEAMAKSNTVKNIEKEIEKYKKNFYFFIRKIR